MNKGAAAGISFLVAFAVVAGILYWQRGAGQSSSPQATANGLGRTQFVISSHRWANTVLRWSEVHGKTFTDERGAQKTAARR